MGFLGVFLLGMGSVHNICGSLNLVHDFARMIITITLIIMIVPTDMTYYFKIMAMIIFKTGSLMNVFVLELSTMSKSHSAQPYHAALTSPLYIKTP